MIYRKLGGQTLADEFAAMHCQLSVSVPAEGIHTGSPPPKVT